MNDTNIRTQNSVQLEGEHLNRRLYVNCKYINKKEHKKINTQKQHYSQCGPSSAPNDPKMTLNTITQSLYTREPGYWMASKHATFKEI